MSKYLQPEELTLLLIRLRRHQAKLASIRNYTIAQLLQHLPTNSTYQVSCCLALLCSMTFCDSANASSVACSSLCFLAHSSELYSSQVVCSFSLLLYSLWDKHFKLQGASASATKCYMSFLFILFLKMLHLQKCGLKDYAHSEAKPFLCAAFMMGLAPCPTCCVTCKSKRISQFVHPYELVTVSVLQVNISS